LKYERLKAGSQNADNIKQYDAKLKEWQMKSKFAQGLPYKPIAKAIPDGIINNKEWEKAEFPTPKKFAKHIEKHIGEYDNISEAEYLAKAQELLAAELSANIEGFVDNEGFVFKYNKLTNDFAIGRPDGKISTLFKPENGEEYWKGERIKYEPKH